MSPPIVQSHIESRIFTIRGVQVMLDSELAELYGVEPRRLNEQVKRNLERFPEEFRFQLTEQEYKNLRSQFATSRSMPPEQHGGRRYLPYAFTEQGVAMLSAVLRSDTAIQTSIQIINAFVGMRRFIAANVNIFARLDQVEKRQISHEIKTDERFEQIFNALENKSFGLMERVRNATSKSPF